MTTKHRPSAMPKWCGKVPARYSDSSTSGMAPSAGPHGRAGPAEQSRDQHLERPGVVEGDAGVDVGVAQRQHGADQRHHGGREGKAQHLDARGVDAGVPRHRLVLADGAQGDSRAGCGSRTSCPTMVSSATASSVS